MSKRAVIAVVTGFTKCRALVARSLEPLSALARDGVIDRILYVTWDAPAIDDYVEPATAFDNVTLIRVPEPRTSGIGLERAVHYQIHNLEAALARIPEDDALIVKLRPDFVFDKAFLRDKIARFDELCAPSRLAESFGVAAPPSPFQKKLWVPWADANLFFHIEDAAFIGLKADVAKLANEESAAIIRELDLPEKGFGPIAHISRFALPFLESLPLFANYVRNYRYFFNDKHHRAAVMGEAAKHDFFWQLVVANAWILAANFHVDCGRQGELTFYANRSNRHANWSSLESLNVHPPYNAVEEWRGAQQPGGVLPGAGRLFARLVDDSWQTALFSGRAPRDVAPEALKRVLASAISSRPGDAAEREMYRALEICCHTLAEIAPAA